MIWWIVIPAVAVAALAYAYWAHGKQSRHLARLFAARAKAYNGDVKAGTFLALPQLRFQRDGRKYFVGAMASGGPNVAGSASRPGFNGPFTFANLELPFDTGREVRILRTDKLDRGFDAIVSAATGGQLPTTGDEIFDLAFRVQASDQAFVRRALDEPLREKLLNSTPQRLEVSLVGATISVHIDDYVKSAGDLDEMIDIATLLADNCDRS